MGPEASPPPPPPPSQPPLPGEFDAPRAARPAEPAEPAPVFAPDFPAPAFGAPGQFVLSGGTNIALSSTSFDGSDASLFGVSFSPGMDYFFLRNVSVGLDLGVAYSDTKSYGADSSLVEATSTTLSAGPRFGLNVPLTRALSFYPRVTLGVESVHQELSLVKGRTISTPASATGSGTKTQAGLWISGSAPLLLHPMPRFFVGAGPSIFHGFARTQEGPDIGGQRTSVGLTITTGGYWGGPPEEAEPRSEAAPPDAPLHRFGDARQWVVTSDLGGGVSYGTRAGTSSSTLALVVAPGIDYFVARHVAFGAGISVSHSYAKGTDPTTQATVTNEHTGVALSPRVSVDIPLGAWVSWYLRAQVSLGEGWADEESRGSADKYNDSWLAIGGFTPLLFHPAQHVFFGFGPSLSHDFVHDFAFPNTAVSPSNRATTVGASFLLGGWI